MQTRYTRSDRLHIDMVRIMRIVARRLFASGIGAYFVLSVRIGFGIGRKDWEPAQLLCRCAACLCTLYRMQR